MAQSREQKRAYYSTPYWKAWAKAYREKHRDEQREYQMDYRKRNVEKSRAYKGEWYERNKARVLQRRREYYEANKETVAVKTRDWARRNKSKLAVYVWNRRHPGFSRDQRDRMILAQDGKCAICTKSLGRTPHVDHDHQTGKVRAVLCHNCNRGIGFLKDSPEIVRAALAYLEHHTREGESNG